MFEKKSELDYIVSGKAQWAVVFQPDKRLKFMSKDEYEYVFRTDLIMSEEDMSQLMYLRVKKDIKQDFRKDKKTGVLSFQFKRDAVLEVDTETAINPPLVVDAAGNKMDGSELIGNDSEVKISFKLIPFGKNQDKHRVILNGIQVLKLEEYKKSPLPPPPPVDVDCFNTGDPKDIPF